MPIREAKWHQSVKESLKQIGEKNGFDVSESETEMYFPIKYKLFSDGSAEKRILTYKPDVVWKKGMQYYVIFEIEYLNPKSPFLDKRKYALGTLLLGLTALHEKSCKNFLLITNKEILCEDVGSCFEILRQKRILSKVFTDSIDVIWYCLKDSINEMKKELREYLSEDFRLK